MPNISQLKRERMLSFLNELKNTHCDDASIRAFNEIENFHMCKEFASYNLVVCKIEITAHINEFIVFR